MRLTSPADIKALLRQADVTPSKTLGQNFLFDANIRDAIVEMAEVGPDDTVMEIGPGLGVLTEALLEKAHKVIAIEMDARLHAHLQRFFGPLPHLELHRADALDLDLKSFLRGGVTRVVSNLPYSAASRILFEFSGPGIAPKSITAMIQSDVADRLDAAPGSKQYGLLSIWMQMFYDLKARRSVRPSVFYPAPRVDSTVLHFEWRAEPRFDAGDWKRFLDIVKYAFTRRRKQMAGIFRGAPAPITCTTDQLKQASIDPTSRPETIPVEAWGKLTRILSGS